MNRVGLKDYLLNHADDNGLLDCAKAWDTANEYGQFDTYSSVEEAAQANGWDAAQALSEARRVDQDADFFRLNGYGHLESVNKATLSFSKFDDINADKIDLANAAYAAVENYYKYADGRSTEEVQAKFRNEHGRGLSAERADQLTAACEKNMDALKRVLDDDEIEAWDFPCWMLRSIWRTTRLANP